MDAVIPKIEDLKTFLNDYNAKIEKLIIDKNEAEKIFVEIDFFTKQKLNQIFGDEKDTNITPNFKDILSYDNVNNKYSDAVIYSYWTYRGESDIYSQEIEGDWRRNFFYKGVRWSNKFYKNKFYHFFKHFEEATNGYTTVEFFVELGIKFQKRYFSIGIDNSITKIEKDKIILPNNEFLRNLKIDELTELINKIKRYREILGQDKVEFNEEKKKDEFSSDKFKKLYNNAWENTKESEFLENTIKIFNKYFDKNWEQEEKKEEIVFGVIITLLYFDHPYDIHFFLPNNNDEKETNGKAKASLIITTGKDTTIDEETKNILLELINVLKIQSIIEKKVINKLKNILPNYLRFKDKYLSIVDKYERLSEIAINIVKAIAYKNNIKFTYELFRVKNFDSFFEKIVKIANNNNDERHKDFSEIINKVQTDKLESICSQLSDIAGARIVCLFQEESEIIINELETLNNQNEIEIIERIDYVQSHDKNDISKFGYRSIHRILRLGDKRLNIYEFQDLKNIQCELQIRTLLADVWANASHQLFYKNKFPKNFDELNGIKSTFHAISGELKNRDKDLNRIRQDIYKLFEKHFKNGK